MTNEKQESRTMYALIWHPSATKEEIKGLLERARSSYSIGEDSLFFSELEISVEDFNFREELPESLKKYQEKLVIRPDMVFRCRNDGSNPDYLKSELKTRSREGSEGVSNPDYLISLTHPSLVLGHLSFAGKILIRELSNEREFFYERLNLPRHYFFYFDEGQVKGGDE